MMLASALELSKHVQEQEVVSWGQEKSVEIYVESLKRAVEKLSKENNLLTTYHLQIMEKVRYHPIPNKNFYCIFFRLET